MSRSSEFHHHHDLRTSQHVLCASSQAIAKPQCHHVSLLHMCRGLAAGQAWVIIRQASGAREPELLPAFAHEISLTNFEALEHLPFIGKNVRGQCL